MPPTNSIPTLAHRLRFAVGSLRRTVCAWILAGWAVAGSLWGWLGIYDLALSQIIPLETASKFPRAYQAAGMLSAWLSSWSFWIIGGLILAFGAAVEYGVRAEQRGAQAAEAARRARIAQQATLPPDSPLAKLVAFSEGLSRMLTESPKPRPPSPPMIIEPDPEPEWDKLYELDEDGADIRLLLVPYGDDVEGHTLLLVLYGYKLKLGLDRVEMTRAVHAACRAEREAPNASMRGRAFSFAGMAKALEPEKYGKGAIARGEVEHVDLSKGGRFEITGEGIRRADRLARDLILRA